MAWEIPRCGMISRFCELDAKPIVALETSSVACHVGLHMSSSLIRTSLVPCWALKHYTKYDI